MPTTKNAPESDQGLEGDDRNPLKGTIMDDATSVPSTTDIHLSPFVEAAARIGSHDGPALLFDWVFSGRLDNPVELAEAVPHAWSSAHIPFSSLGAATWIELFQMAGYTVDGVLADRPSEPLTLYRAAEPRYVHRLAWTGSLDVANRFLEINAARYGAKQRYIYTVTVGADRLLAHITDRDEDEYIVDTRGLAARRIERAS